MDTNTRGIKRKLPDEDVWVDEQQGLPPENYTFYRQSLLNITMVKFNHGQTLVEPSLRRYVLIANTLRVIQEEIQRDPCPVPLGGVQSPGGAMGLSEEAPSVMMEARVSVLPEDLDNILVPGVDDDLSVSSAIANILKELENVLDEGSPQNLLRLSGNQNPDFQVESGLRISTSYSPSPLQLPEKEVSSIRDESEERRVVSPNLESTTDGKDIALLKELVIAAACTETLPELPVAMDTSTLEEVSNKSNPEPLLPEEPVPMDILPPKVQHFEAQPVKTLSTGSTQRPTETVFGNFEIMSSSYLKDLALDDFFSDIDTSVFEREANSSGPLFSGRYYPPEDYRFTSSCNTVPFTQGQGNDLDNIMEILVGS
ncbi:SERTA domain-containing protein 2-like isoform 1-T3 [Discoglossus pictus]